MQGGRFVTNMRTKDGSASFDLGGVYATVEPERLLNYTLDDGRKVEVSFTAVKESTMPTQRFEPATVSSEELQCTGWQAILNNFKNYVEGQQ